MEKGLFVWGKFGLDATDEPYTAIINAFSEICRSILYDAPRDSLETVGLLLKIFLGNDIEILAHLIPELEDIVPSTYSTTIVADTDVDRYDIDNGQGRWKFYFRVLTRVLTSVFSPLVLVLDDLQWADISSLEVMDNLISDSQNPNPLLIIGCYRSNEVHENTVLYNRLQAMQQKKQKYKYEITEIRLENFGVDDVNKMIMEMLSLDDPETTRGLAEICHKRTDGNPFFIVEYLLLLQNEQLLSYNIGLMKWTFSVEKIEGQTMAASNVVSLLQQRMQELPTKFQLFPRYASCLSSSFSIKTLEFIWTNKEKMEVDSARGFIEEAMVQSFIEATPVGNYRWAHDQIQEAACSMGDEEKALFQYSLGVFLYSGLTKEKLQDSLFDVADLINRGIHIENSTLYAEVNLQAAEKARELSAFESAANYATNGIKFLPSSKWTADRGLTLRLYTMAAELCFALGRVQSADAHSKEVLSRGDCTIMERLPFQLAVARKLCTIDLNFPETIKVCLSMLKKLGCRLVWCRPTIVIQAFSTLLRTIKLAKKMLANFEGLPPMTDLRQQTIMHLLSRLGYACYNAEEIFLQVLATCEMVRITLKHGVNEVSAIAIACLGGFASAVQRDFDTGAELAQLSISMQHKLRDTGEAETMFNAFCYSIAWKQPIQNLAFNESYISGMRNGNPVHAMWCLLGANVWVPYVTGRPLKSILQQFPATLSQVEEMSQPQQEIVLKIFWQMIWNLMYPGQKSHELEGDIFSRKRFAGKNTVHVGVIMLCEGELQLFSNIEAAADRALELGDKFQKTLPAMFVGMIEAFHRGVALYTMARRTKKRKYRAKANKVRKMIARWEASGNPNVKHYHALLKAEHAALENNHQEAHNCYQQSVVFAAKTGHIHHTALCNERYADYLLNSVGNKADGVFRLEEALRFYMEWGAWGKVEMLKRRINDNNGSNMTETPLSDILLLNSIPLDL